MSDQMGRLLDATMRELATTLAIAGQRPSPDLARALRAQLALSLNRARLCALTSPPLSEPEVFGDWAHEATLPMGVTR